MASDREGIDWSSISTTFSMMSACIGSLQPAKLCPLWASDVKQVSSVVWACWYCLREANLREAWFNLWAPPCQKWAYRWSRRESTETQRRAWSMGTRSTLTSLRGVAVLAWAVRFSHTFRICLYCIWSFKTVDQYYQSHILNERQKNQCSLITLGTNVTALHNAYIYLT